MVDGRDRSTVLVHSMRLEPDSKQEPEHSRELVPECNMAPEPGSMARSHS